MTNPPAWHPDPLGRHDHRWWDGERWTEHVADAGQASIDPLDSGPADAGASDEATGGAPDTGATGGPAGGPADTGATGSTAGGQATEPTGGAWSQPGQQPADQQPGQPGAAEPQWGQPGQAASDQWAQSGQPPGPGAGAGAWSQDQPAGGWPPAADGPVAAPTGRTDGMAVAAIVVGILSLLISFIPLIGLIGLLGGIVALVLGLVARGRIRRTGAPGSGQAITGVVTGALAIVVTVVWIAVIIAGFRGAGGFGMFRDYADCLDETGDQEFCDEQLERDIERRIFRN